ncbi:unnamed protein product [Mytilus edulis]|uniref:Fibronectin type-III domain-containing protein n=1 Tax=Mytilus edulis TaxID=6550 RepID=A0A8S3UAM9_MYTED|nr:unnamed protein product [Mytilus edulis]
MSSFFCQASPSGVARPFKCTPECEGVIAPQEGPGNNVKKIDWYEERKTKYSCKFWKWGRCTKYISEYYYRLECYPGWTQSYNSPNCDYAICDGKTDLTGACETIYQKKDCQITRTETICNSGGNCSSPDVCSNCKHGFYSDGPYCRICGTITHCKYTRCTTSSNQHCEWCEGEIFPMRYWRAYIRHLDKTKCQLDNTPTIEYNHCKFSDNGGHNILENYPNWKTTGHPTNWTNFVGYTKVSVVQTAKYVQPKVNITDHYVKNYSIGVIEERVTLSYYKGSTFNEKKTQTCSGMNRDKPVTSKQCTFTFAISTWSLTHNDRVVAEFSSTNGGYVIVANRDIKPHDSDKSTYYYSGKTLTRRFEYHWDLKNPSIVLIYPKYHPDLSFSWGGWSDDLAGLDHYEYDLYYLEANGVNDDAVLIDGRISVSKHRVPVTESSGSLRLTVAGMYSLHLVAFDKAGNYKLGRNLFLYDNQIEWEAYDIHSGLYSVFWRLYDSMTDVLHGHEDVIAQGHATNLTHCEDKYSQYPRGANCYCTPFHGCFHRHFQIKPEIKEHGGLIANRDSGTHEYDYFIEITVTSIANLTTVLTRKITIDVSPPHSGAVHDGLQGNPEIDYQQGMDLNAYWDQFFDRESGVFFYQYIVNTSCADKTDFVLDDSSVPGVKEVVVKDSIITGGLVKHPDTFSYYILGPDRIRRLIPNPTADCIAKATALHGIDLFPLMRNGNGSIVEVDGNIFCSNSSSSPNVIGLTLFKSSLLEMSWEPLDIPAKVFEYEVGFSSTAGSTAPDIMAFESTKQHAHVRVMHTNIPDGTQFFIIIKTISKSNVEGLMTLGPCFMDTTPPEIVGGSGIFTVQMSGEYLVTSWPGAAVSDSEELFTLDYQFAIGHSAYGTDVQGFQPLRPGSTCTLTQPPSCTAVNVSDLDWYLHGHHTYYVSIKVTNTAGQAAIQSSGPYIHDVQLPAEGVVLDIETQDISTHIPFKDIQDIDFQTATNSMAALWSGFAHPHLDVTYRISIGTTMGGSDVLSMKDVGTSLVHKETGLSLSPYQKYYFTVTAVTSAGNVSKSSDGITIVTENDVLSGVSIFDGEPCNMKSKLIPVAYNL